MPMQPWFTDAKLGIFVHWGIYAVDGVQESWSFYDDIVPHDRYMSQLDRSPAPGTTLVSGPTCSPARGPGMPC